MSEESQELQAGAEDVVEVGSSQEKVPEACSTPKRKHQATLGRCFGWADHRSPKSEEVLEEEQVAAKKRCRQEEEAAYKQEVEATGGVYVKLGSIYKFGRQRANVGGRPRADAQVVAASSSHRKLPGSQAKKKSFGAA